MEDLLTTTNWPGNRERQKEELEATYNSPQGAKIIYSTAFKAEARVLFPTWDGLHRLLDNNDSRGAKLIREHYRVLNHRIRSQEIEVEKVRQLLLKS